MGVRFEFHNQVYDYGNFQTISVKIEIKKWVHHFGAGYRGKNRIPRLDEELKQKLETRFWRYIGAA